MTTITCPHCGKPIELVGQRELSEDYGIGPNPVQHARSLGVFPMPVLQFGNRNMWLRGDIEAYIEEKNRERIAKLVKDFEQTIAVLPEDEQEQAREMLVGGNTPTRKRR
jgi:hypothetical protein